MKIKGLIFTFLVMFVAANVFSGSKKEYEKKIQTIQNENTDLRVQIADLKARIPETPKPAPVPQAPQDQLVPITREIINAVKEHDLRLEDLGYYLSVPLSLVNHNQDVKGVIDKNGKFTLNEENLVKEIKISNLDKGVLERYSKGDRENFEIAFPDKNVKLTFARNEGKNCFDLISAFDTDKKYSVLPVGEEPIPQLCIYYNHKFDPDDRIIISSLTASRIAELQDEIEAANNKYIKLLKRLDNSDLEIASKREELAITKFLISELEEKLLSVKIDNAQLKGEFSLLFLQKDKLSGELKAAYSQISELERALSKVVNYPPVNKTNTKSIQGKGTLEKNDIVAYIRLKNPSAPRKDVEVIIETYIKEAQREHINHDIAIAQMCYATDFLKNQQFIKAHNYAGFDALNGAPIKYANMNEGIRAHIQHLKGYASCDLPEGKIVDKRFYILIDNRTHGTVTTLEALCEKWSPGNPHAYANRINGILDDLYLY